MFIGVTSSPTKRSLAAPITDISSPDTAPLTALPSRGLKIKKSKKRAHGPGGDSGDDDSDCDESPLKAGRRALRLKERAERRALRLRAKGPGGDSDDSDSHDSDCDA